LGEEQAETAFLLYASMAADAFLIENGFYIGVEIDLFRKYERVPANGDRDQQGSDEYFVPE
jgi:hypothetical protein